MKIDKMLIKKRILPTLLISSLLPLVIFLSVPFEIYANNYSEFLFSFSDFFFVGIGFFFLFVAIIFSILLLLPKRAYKVFSALIIACSFLLFFQGTFLNGKMNSLGGDMLAGGGYSTVAVVFDALFWVAILAVSVVLALLKDKKGIISISAIILSFIVIGTQIITPVSLSISKKEMFVSATERIKQQNSDSEHKILSTKGLNTVSTNSNIYYFVIDRFDEAFAEKAFEADPEIYKNLTGFTWFQDNLSIYGHTYPAIADMLTNNGYDSTILRNEFLNNIYKDNNTLSVLNDNGYDVKIYTQSYYSFTDAYYLPSYIKNRESSLNNKINDKVGLFFSVVNMALYRGLPLAAKNLFTVNSLTSNSYVSESTVDGNEAYSVLLKDLNNQFIKNKYDVTENKQFSFIHTEGCHDTSSIEDEYGVHLVKQNFKMINKYIEVLKDKGLYDDATIIITGDHGFGTGDAKEMTRPVLTALFVKPSGVGSGDLKISKAQTSLKNIWATIIKSENIETNFDYGKSVFEIPEDVDQERTYVWHTYGCKLIEYTYKIIGNGRDFNNWKKVNETSYDREIMD